MSRIAEEERAVELRRERAEVSQHGDGQGTVPGAGLARLARCRVRMRHRSESAALADHAADGIAKAPVVNSVENHVSDGDGARNRDGAGLMKGDSGRTRSLPRSCGLSNRSVSAIKIAANVVMVVSCQ